MCVCRLRCQKASDGGERVVGEDGNEARVYRHGRLFDAPSHYRNLWTGINHEAVRDFGAKKGEVGCQESGLGGEKASFLPFDRIELR